MDCRACGTELEPFMSFGQMPLANGFLTAEEVPREKFYELAPAVCRECGLFQIMEQPMPDRMFHANYPYYTSNSTLMQAHFEHFAKSIGPGFVVELGCNDGTMLRHFINRRHLGIEPAANVAKVAEGRGCNVLHTFFDNDSATDIASEHGQADYILAANVICHIADLPDLCEGVRTLLSDNGRFIFEEPYLPAMLNRTSFDQVYDEHVFMFSTNSVRNAFSRYGLYLIDCEAQWAHGGSMRYTLSKQRSGITDRAVDQLIFELPLRDPETYTNFKQRCEQAKQGLRAAIIGIRQINKQRIVGYGATSKSTTVLNYCELTPDDIEFISDTTPIKQGKLSPGAHIPVRPYEEFQKNPPDVALLFAWNHRDEIMAKEKDFTGKWLNYVPSVQLS